jgi:hypothetical protein
LFCFFQSQNAIALVGLGELDLVRVLGVVLLVDVVEGLVESRLVADTLGGVRLGELLELSKLLVREVDGWDVSGGFW